MEAKDARKNIKARVQNCFDGFRFQFIFIKYISLVKKSAEKFSESPRLVKRILPLEFRRRLSNEILV